jgi:hypothetical protein
MNQLKGRSVVITGASSGIGAAAAELFAREGSKVILAARRMERLEALAGRIRDLGGEALPVPLDVSRPEQAQGLVETTLATFGKVDILFNNAGFGRMDWLEDLDPVRDIRAQIEVDLLGMIWMARAVLPDMYRRRSGTIINMCSMAGWVAPPLYSAYSAAKFGVRGFTEALRREARHFGVKVCIVYPSGAETEFGRHVGTSAARQRFAIPARLRLSAAQVAGAVVNLAKRPRREVTLPWWMAASRFLNSHFGSASDEIQAVLLKPYHNTP